MPSVQTVHVLWGPAYGYLSIFAVLFQLGVISMVYEKGKNSNEISPTS